MRHDEAKQLLELCRPGNEADRQDPALAEAFALLDTDAGLRAWFEAQQATDARISASLNSLEAPADLKAGILAGMRLHQGQDGLKAALQPEPAGSESWSAPFRASRTDEKAASACPQNETADSTRRAWWRQPWIGIAAVFAVALVILYAPETAPGTNAPDSIALAGLPPVIQFLSGEIDSLKSRQFDKRDENPENLTAYLVSHQAPSPDAIPDCLSKMPSIGCVTFDYKNAKLSMICFKNGNVYHLVTADKATYPDPLPEQPSLFECKDKAFRLWVDGEQVKILTVHGTKEDIPEFI